MTLKVMRARKERWRGPGGRCVDEGTLLMNDVVDEHDQQELAAHQMKHDEIKLSTSK